MEPTQNAKYLPRPSPPPGPPAGRWRQRRPPGAASAPPRKVPPAVRAASQLRGKLKAYRRMLEAMATLGCAGVARREREEKAFVDQVRLLSDEVDRALGEIRRAVAAPPAGR